MPPAPISQVPSVYRRRVGDVTVTALCDGALVRTHEMMRGVSETEGQAALDASFRPGFILMVNAYLIQAGDRLALVDTGSGAYMGDDAGKLPQAMAAAGVAPGDIDTVLLTHMHPDHSAGLTDMTTGQTNFPNAELMVHEAEPLHWYDDAAMAQGTEREKVLMFQQAREQCQPYADRTRLFTGGDVFP